jgi:aspartate carbamoyltransferase catalytic subunit
MYFLELCFIYPSFFFPSEEAVLEIKRQSTIALQKAVSQTEEKSNEILLREREQYERLNQELKTKTFEEAYTVFNRQEDGPEVRFREKKEIFLLLFLIYLAMLELRS